MARPLYALPLVALLASNPAAGQSNNNEPVRQQIERFYRDAAEEARQDSVDAVTEAAIQDSIEKALDNLYHRLQDSLRFSKEDYSHASVVQDTTAVDGNVRMRQYVLSTADGTKFAIISNVADPLSMAADTTYFPVNPDGATMERYWGDPNLDKPSGEKGSFNNPVQLPDTVLFYDSNIFRPQGCFVITFAKKKTGEWLPEVKYFSR